MRILLDAGADRAAAAPVGENASCSDGKDFVVIREIARAEPAWWHLAPLCEDLLADAELSPIWTADRLEGRLRHEPEVHRSNGLLWRYSERPCAAWLPFSEICAEISGRADAWRRRRGSR